VDINSSAKTPLISALMAQKGILTAKSSVYIRAMKLFIIGYMGCGKSAVGTVISTKTGLPFIDLDDRIENEIGQSIAAIFKTRGESFFRTLEQDTLGEVNSSREEFVLSTGGGTPCFGDGLRRMQMAGKVVYLKSTVDNLLIRLEPSIEKRPILASKPAEERRQFIVEHLSQREKFYSQADIIVDVDGKTVSEIADEILAQASK